MGELQVLRRKGRRRTRRQTYCIVVVPTVLDESRVDSIGVGFFYQIDGRVWLEELIKYTDSDNRGRMVRVLEQSMIASEDEIADVSLDLNRAEFYSLTEFADRSEYEMVYAPNREFDWTYEGHYFLPQLSDSRDDLVPLCKEVCILLLESHPKCFRVCEEARKERRRQRSYTGYIKGAYAHSCDACNAENGFQQGPQHLGSTMNAQCESFGIKTMLRASDRTDVILPPPLPTGYKTGCFFYGTADLSLAYDRTEPQMRVYPFLPNKEYELRTDIYVLKRAIPPDASPPPPPPLVFGGEDVDIDVTLLTSQVTLEHSFEPYEPKEVEPCYLVEGEYAFVASTRLMSGIATGTRRSILICDT